MKPVRLLSLVAGSVALALAAGSLYQPDAPTPPDAAALALVDPASGDATANAPVSLTAAQALGPDATLDPVPEAMPTHAAGPTPAGALDGFDATRLTRLLRAIPSPADAGPDSGPDSGPDIRAAGSGCAPALALQPQAGAMLGLSLAAPCLAGQSLTLAHGALRLDLALDPAGRLDLTLPALAPEAEVTLTLADGRQLSETVALADFAGLRRLVLTWEGPLALDLVAPDEFDLDLRLTGTNGAQARVLGLSPGIDWIEGELAIGPESCGRSLAAQVHLIRDDGPIRRRDLVMDLPGCEAAGGFVLIPDLLPEGWSDDLPGFPDAGAAASRSIDTLPVAIRLARAD